MTPPTTRAKAPAEDFAAEPAAGLTDVTSALRRLARNSRTLVTDAGEVLERELSMTVALSERLRDESVSGELLKDARDLRIQSEVRGSAHRVVDLVADAVGVATVSAVRFAERLVDEPRADLRANVEVKAAAASA